MTPLPIHLASIEKLRFGNPFTVKNAVVFTIMLGILVAGTVTIDNLRWISADADYWMQFSLALLHNLLLAGILLGYCFAIYDRCLKKLPSSLTATPYVVAATSGVLAISFLYSIMSRWVRRVLFNDLGIVDIIDITIINDLLLAVTVLLLTSLLCSLTRRQKVVIENENLHAEQLITRYEALEKQVNPHFLFNSLNTLGGLIGVDDQKAALYLHQLASAYRYVMQQHESHTVTLAEEMEFVDTFFSMMQIRYGGHLTMDRSISTDLLDYKLPPISIQLLVENAIKHNVVSARHPLTITVATTPNATIRVSNPLQPKQELHGTESSHVGLENLSQRYQVLFHTNIDVNRTDDEFVVELPLIKS